MARDGFDKNHEDREDSIVARLLELKAASAQARPLPGVVRRIAARLEERSMRSHLAVALTAAALAASVSLAFWWDAASRLTMASVVTSVDDGDGLGLEP
ncbi:MAG TPA: hypothetical protein VMI54_11905 [Polyangiaceae bacterium]|nr:hypothetical protein [Polyangiaceae bacterium]